MKVIGWGSVATPGILSPLRAIIFSPHSGDTVAANGEAEEVGDFLD